MANPDAKFAIMLATTIAHHMSREELVNKLQKEIVSFKADPTNDEAFQNIARVSSLIGVKLQTEKLGYEKATQLFQDGNQAMDAFDIHKNNQS